MNQQFTKKSRSIKMHSAKLNDLFSIQLATTPEKTEKNELDPKCGSLWYGTGAVHSTCDMAFHGDPSHDQLHQHDVLFFWKNRKMKHVLTTVQKELQWTSSTTS